MGQAAASSQSSQISAVCVGLQPGQLPAAIGSAGQRTTLVTAQHPGQADQDRGQGSSPRTTSNLPDGGSGGIQAAL